MSVIDGETQAARALRVSGENPNPGHDYSTWQGKAAGGIMRDLCDRAGIKSELRQCDPETILDILKAHTDIIATAHEYKPFTNGMAHRAVFQGEFIRALSDARAIAMCADLGRVIKAGEEPRRVLLDIWWEE